MGDALQLVGNICNFAARPSSDEDTAAHEGQGAFVAGDAASVAAWSGLDRGERWKVRVLGPLAEMPMLWNHVRSFQYHGDRAAAAAHLEQIKQVLGQSVEGAHFVPHPNFPEGSAPGGQVELLVDGSGQNAGVLMLDREHDYDYAMSSTPGMGVLSAGTVGGPRLVSWMPPPSPALVAFGPGRDGRVDHVVLAFTPGPQDKRPLVAGGLPGATRDPKIREVVIDVPSGVLVAQWARVSGAMTLGPLGADPGPALVARLGAAPAGPLDVRDGDLGGRLAGPVAWAFRVTPGKWRAQVLYTDTPDGAGLSALVLSRDGAGSFQLMQGGGAGGRVIEGLTLERYAMLAAERDAVNLRASQGAGGALGSALMGAVGGGAVPELTALAARYGLPPSESPGMLCRVDAWEQLIQGNAALSAEYVAFYAVAQAKLSGADVDIDAVRAQALANHEAVAANARAHASATELTREGHFLVFEAARTRTPEQLIHYARETAYRHLKPDELAWAMGRALSELCLHADDPIRVQRPRQVCPSFLAALWEVTPPAEREGSLARFVKNETANVEEAYGIQAPSLLDRL